MLLDSFIQKNVMLIKLARELILLVLLFLISDVSAFKGESFIR